MPTTAMPDTSNTNATIRVMSGTFARHPIPNERFRVTASICVNLCLSALQIEHVKLQAILLIPNTRLDRVGEFDAALHLRRLSYILNTIPPNSFQRTVLRTRKPQLQMLVLQDRRLRQAAQIPRRKHRSRIACSKRFQLLKLTRKLKRDLLSRQ